ncbi:hypothetical protein [Endozoicomonas atrinae]|uniref:hypothetical protein n=1 Tax=Endozoicomonas atrinae TaxID=1333660 RepID=UPI003B00D189
MPSGNSLLDAAEDLSPPGTFAYQPVSTIDLDTSLADKYGTVLKEAIGRYNRHGEEFNALISNHNSGGGNRSTDNRRLDLLGADAESRYLLARERLKQLKKCLRSDYLQLLDICRVEAGRQLMGIPEKECDEFLVAIIALYAEHAHHRRQLDETWKYTGEQKVEVLEALELLPDEADLADQVERLVSDIETHRNEAAKLKGDAERYQKSIAGSPNDRCFYELRLNTCLQTLETEEKYLAEHQDRLAESGRQLEQLEGLKRQLKDLESSRQVAQAKVESFWQEVEGRALALWEQYGQGTAVNMSLRGSTILSALRADVAVLAQSSVLPWMTVKLNQQGDPAWYYFALVQYTEQ